MTFVYVGGRRCLNFVGTMKHRDSAREELLTRPELLSEFVVQGGLLDGAIHVTDDDLAAANGPVGPSRSFVQGVPQPPASIPHVASRTVPVPKPSPLNAKPAAQPAQQSAAVQPKPADAQAAVPPAPAPAIVEAKPAAPAIQPTQEMPQVQGLE